MVTIFTPVYNRAYIIDNLYDSLMKQSNFNFEWIIIDDGSTDNLEEKVKRWMELMPPFKIIYKYVKNGGKHRAINIGAKLAQGQAFFIVDSDDYISSDAVEFIETEFPQIMDNDEFAGISGLKAFYNQSDVVGGNPKFDSYVDATNLEREKYGLLGDKAEVYKTEIWKKYPFPEFEGENFLLEEVVLNRIALDGLKIRWFNVPIYYCEYLKDGLTRNLFDLKVANPLGWIAQISTVKLCGKEELFQKEVYKFYEAMHDRYEQKEFCEIFEVSETYYKRYKNEWDKKLYYISEKVEGLKNIAIYGVGGNSKRLELYLKELNVTIQYGIDKNAGNIQRDYRIYTLGNELPEIRNLCITLEKIPQGLVESVKQKLPLAQIWIFNEII